jgi:hypothetical protein
MEEGMLRMRNQEESAHTRNIHLLMVEPIVEQAHVRGAAGASSVDADFGETRPAAAVEIDRIAAAEATSLRPDFFNGSAADEARLHESGAEMKLGRSRLQEADRERQAAVEAMETTATALARHEKHFRWTGPGAALLAKAVLIGVGLGDCALAALVLKLLGLSGLTTLVIAGVVGISQLLVLHYLAELYAATPTAPIARQEQGGTNAGVKVDGEPSPESGTANGPFGKPRIILLTTLALPVLAMAVLAAWLRADYLSLQTAEFANSPGMVSFSVAMATFFAMQMVLNSLAWIIGYRYGAPSVKAALAAHSQASRAQVRHRLAQRRYANAEARFGVDYAEALGRCSYTEALAEKAWAEGRAATCAYDTGLGSGRPELMSVFSEEAQINAIDAESEARLAAVLAAIAKRRQQLIDIAGSYVFTYVSSAVERVQDDEEGPNGDDPRRLETSPKVREPAGIGSTDISPTNGKRPHYPVVASEGERS